jgi:hypothetical protein
MGQNHPRREGKAVTQDDYANKIRARKLHLPEENMYLSDDDSGTCGVCYPKRISSVYVKYV